MAESQPPVEINGPIVIRVFVSATFKYMQREREELIIFPKLRKLRQPRSEVWSEVNLRCRAKYAMGSLSLTDQR